jgi:hypothetical protein
VRGSGYLFEWRPGSGLASLELRCPAGWFAIGLPTQVRVWLANGSLPVGHRPVGSGSRGSATLEVALPSLRCDSSEQGEEAAKVVVGVDPHKRLNAVVVINVKGRVLARG